MAMVRWAAMTSVTLSVVTATPCLAMQTAAAREGDAATAPAAGAPSSASAVAAAGGPGAATSEVISEVVVTAQRRSERLQDVPITITALSGHNLTSAGVLSSLDLNKLVPSLTYTKVQGFNSPFLRGVGTTNITAGDEPSVATYIDGVYQGSTLTASLPFNNVDRIEVLKGPQGTLYGRNASGGLINIVTRTPGQTFIADGSVTYGSYEAVEGDGYIGGPLTSRLSADLSVHVRNQARGYDLNAVTGDRVGQQNFTALRSKWIYDFAPGTSLTLTADYTTSFDTTSTGGTIYPGTTPLLGAPYLTPTATGVAVNPGGLFSTKPYHRYNILDPVFVVTTYGGAATFKTDIGFAEVTSITGYRHTKQLIETDSSDTTVNGVLAAVSPDPLVGVVAPASLSYASREDDPYFFTQDLQVASKPGGPLNWIVGAFFQDSKEGYKPIDIAFAARQTFAEIKSMESTKAGALYGQATYKFSSGLSLTGGLRYSVEKKALNGDELVAGALAATTDKSHEFHSLTYRAAADYRYNPEISVYASASRGFKSGLFVANQIDNSPAVLPEQLDAYEVGVKTNPRRNIQLNGSFYYYDYTNLQQFIVATNGFSGLQNAPGAEMYGAEVELQIIPIEHLNVRTAIGLEHSEYTDFPNAQGYQNSPISGGEETVSVDVKGRQLTRTPKFTGTLGADYDVPLGGRGTLTFSGNVYHTSSFPWGPTNYFKQGQYTLLDLSATWALLDGHWRATVWGRNLTNALYSNSVVDNVRSVEMAYAPPATVGATISYKY